MGMIRLARAVLGLPPRRWIDTTIAAVLAVRVERALARGGVDRAARLGHVRVAMNGSAAPTAPLSSIRLSSREREQLDIAWRVLAHRPFNGTCLRRAIVGGYFLRARQPLLRIGVAKSAGIVTAHAWVEVDGIALDPDASERYAVLSRPETQL